MRNLKRVLSLALALVMVLGMMVITTSAAAFDDADEITNVEAVDVMYALGIVQGDGTGGFDPNGTFTRAAAAKLLTLMLITPDVADKLAGTCAFDDVNSNPAYAWAAPYVAYCSNLGYIVGTGEGTFNPGGVLTDIELGKLVLCALGYDAAKYTGANWAAAVTVDLIEAELVTSVTGTAISREDACQMILDAMKWSKAPEAYNVVKDNKVVYTSTDMLQAYLYAQMLGGKVEIAEPEDTLLRETYDVIYNGDDVDAYGRSITTYKNAATKLSLAFSNAEAVKVYVGKASKLGDELKDYTVDGLKQTEEQKATTEIVYVNGDDTFLSPNKTLADAIVALTGEDKTVEVYASKGNITKIVVIDYTYGKVLEVNEADAKKETKANIVLSNGDKIETSGFEVGDWIKYVKVGEKFENLAKLDTVTGKIASATKDGAYTIGGDTYTAEVEINVEAGMKAEKVYVLGHSGTIVAVDDVAGAKPEVITNYVLIQDSNAKLTKTSWPTAGTVTAATAQVVGILSNGTKAVFDLTTKVEKGAASVKVAGKDVAIVEDGKLNIELGYYTYKLDGTTIELVKVVEPWTSKDPVTKGDLVIDDVYLINDDTTFIMAGANNTIVVKSGKDAFAYGDIVAGADVFYSTEKVKDSKGEETGEVVKTATVVYALDTTYDDGSNTTAKDAIAFVSGNYTVSLVDGELVYTYDAVKADGTVISLTSKDVKSDGLYKYSAKNEIGDKITDYKEGTVDAIVGSIVNVGGKYIAVADGVEPVIVAKDGKWEVGAYIYYFLNDKDAISAIYVVDAPEA